MHVLLDENLPIGLAAESSGHSVETVSGLGWSGIKNGELLLRAEGRFEALLTMDSNLEFQQALSGSPFGVIVIRAATNRMPDLLPLVPEILAALDAIGLVDVRTAGG